MPDQGRSVSRRLDRSSGLTASGLRESATDTPGRSATVAQSRLSTRKLETPPIRRGSPGPARPRHSPTIAQRGSPDSRPTERDQAPESPRTYLRLLLDPQVEDLDATGICQRLALELGRLSRELESTRLQKIKAESGKNALITENETLRAELDSIQANQKYRQCTIKRLERELSEYRNSTERTQSHQASRTRQSDTPPDLRPAVLRLATSPGVIRERQAEQLKALTAENAELRTRLEEALSEKQKLVETQVLLLDLQNELQHIREERDEAERQVEHWKAQAEFLRVEAHASEHAETEAELAQLRSLVGTYEEQLKSHLAAGMREKALVETVAELRNQVHTLTMEIRKHEKGRKGSKGGGRISATGPNSSSSRTSQNKNP
ncbi:hypothetical protein GMRT_23274 [Giardia muris]|uniref:Uncharacterized protein n=1 Tax=Giardia muris TaxID=5742 RepID=A0A4Z1SPE1_GIAMU|nr:hypothetical protein GMRT_23274 [Giardia muris]|eukprot:TNJ27676.1 hypothetical protein GMRT_23274 [Giardia muris]